MPSDGELKEAMGTWLGQLAPWDVFSTWTFSRPVQVGGAMFWARRHLQWIERVAANRIYGFVGAKQETLAVCSIFTLSWAMSGI